MAIAQSLEQFLKRSGVAYELIPHPHTESAQHAAAEAHVPGDRLAKPVILEDEDGYVMAVIPATHRVDLGTMHHQMHRFLGLATEPELMDLFTDCQPGAVPAVGTAYGMETVVDDHLLEQPVVYFEAGDHESLVEVQGGQFQALMKGAAHGPISHHL